MRYPQICVLGLETILWPIIASSLILIMLKSASVSDLQPLTKRKRMLFPSCAIFAHLSPRRGRPSLVRPCNAIIYLPIICVTDRNLKRSSSQQLELMKDKIKNLILVVLKAALVAALTTLGINTTGCVALGKNPSSFTLIERNN